MQPKSSSGAALTVNLESSGGDKTMKRKLVTFLALASGLLAGLNLAPAQGTAFTYQGRLTDSGNPASGNYDLTFSLFAASSGGSQVGATLTNAAVALANGLFTTTLDFGSEVFNGGALWVQIGVRTNGNGAFSALDPRQPITPAPYAITAGDVTSANTNIALLNRPNTTMPASGVPIVTSGFVTGATVTSGGSGYTTPPTVTVNDATGSAATVIAIVSGGSVTGLEVQNAGNNYSAAATLTIGAPPSNAYQTFIGTNFFADVNTLDNPANSFAGSFGGNGAGLTNLSAWRLTGNSGTSPTNGNFVGTADNQPLELWVNGARALRLEPNTNGAPNVLGGSPNNLVDAGVIGGFIGGGGATTYLGTAYTNQVSADFGVIDGGAGNMIQSNALSSTIGGGTGNTIQTSAANSTIGGGLDNAIQNGAQAAVIGGGQQNVIETFARGSTIGGGYANEIANDTSFAVIPGGYLNFCDGDYAFAAGQQAVARYQGDFVWADSQNAPFASTGTNQFLIRAAGGVGIGTASPKAQLHVAGGANQTVAIVDGSSTGGTWLGINNSGGGFQWSIISAGSANGEGAGSLVFFSTQHELHEMWLDGSGNLTLNGALTQHSDRNAKKNVVPVNPRSVLDKVALLPITQWSYKADTDTRHIGPMAQDFKAAFEVGADDKFIAAVDEEGVALAAIQGLNQKLDEKDAEIETLKEKAAKVDSLEKRLTGLERMVQSLAEKK